MNLRNQRQILSHLAVVYCHVDVFYFVLEHVFVMCEFVWVFLEVDVLLARNQLRLLFN